MSSSSSFSNPTPPPNYKPPPLSQENNSNEQKKEGGLKQDDFRKLLITPRQGPPPQTTPSRGSFAPKTPRHGGGNGGGATGGFAKPELPASKMKKKWKKPPTGDAEEPKYRDRAAERRTGANPDYAETERILATLKAAEETDQALAYEQSKYLGGDVEHTHLVKGLDFALLNKVRTQLDKPTASAAEEEEVGETKSQEVRDEEIELAAEQGRAERRRVGKEHEEDESLELHSLMAKTLYDVAVVQAARRPAAKNELFRAGRLAYVFELADELGGYRDAFAIPTTLVRSKAGLLNETGASDVVIDKIVAVMAQPRTARPEEKKKGKKEKRKTNAQEEEVKVKVKEVEIEDEEDLFADAGVDYVEGVHDDEMIPVPDEDQVMTTATVREEEDVRSGSCHPHNDDDDEAFVPQRPPEDYDVDAAFAPERPPEDYDVEAAFASFATETSPERIDAQASTSKQPAPSTSKPKTRTNYFGEDATEEDYLNTGDDDNTEKSRKEFVASVLQKSAAMEKNGLETSVPGFRGLEKNGPVKNFGSAMKEDAYEADYSSFGLGKTVLGKILTTTSEKASLHVERRTDGGEEITTTTGKRSVMSFIPTTPASSSQKRTRASSPVSALRTEKKEDDEEGDNNRSKKPRRDRAKDKLNRDFQALDRFMSNKYGAGLKEDGGKKEAGGGGEKRAEGGGGGGNRRERRAAMRSGK